MVNPIVEGSAVEEQMFCHWAGACHLAYHLLMRGRFPQQFINSLPPVQCFLPLLICVCRPAVFHDYRYQPRSTTSKVIVVERHCVYVTVYTSLLYTSLYIRVYSIRQCIWVYWHKSLYTSALNTGFARAYHYTLSFFCVSMPWRKL